MGYAGAEGSLYIYKSFCQKSTSDRMKKPCDGIIEAGSFPVILLCFIMFVKSTTLARYPGRVQVRSWSK